MVQLQSQTITLTTSFACVYAPGIATQQWTACRKNGNLRMLIHCRANCFPIFELWTSEHIQIGELRHGNAFQHRLLAMDSNLQVFSKCGLPLKTHPPKLPGGTNPSAGVTAAMPAKALPGSPAFTESPGTFLDRQWRATRRAALSTPGLKSPSEVTLSKPLRSHIVHALFEATSKGLAEVVTKGQATQATGQTQLAQKSLSPICRRGEPHCPCFR